MEPPLPPRECTMSRLRSGAHFPTSISRQMFVPILLLLTVTFPTFAIKCHQCGGAENIPKFAKNALNALNITSESLFGDCKSTSESVDVCSNGTFCIKRAKVYQIGYSGVNFKWTSYTKGCATLREDTSGVPSNTCYDLGAVTTNSSGYTAKRVDCYCQKDFCNANAHLFTRPIQMALSLLAISILSIDF